MSPEEYLSAVRAFSAQPVASARDETERNRLRNAPLNLQRMERILRTCGVGEDLRRALGAIAGGQLWMVLTELWCGDSAQCIPHIIRFAACTPHVTLRFLLRDANQDIMDVYLTDGTRGIPKLVAFTEEGVELWRWGPRPRGAQEAFSQARTAGLDKAAALERLHLWYGRDRGGELEREVTALVAGVRTAAHLYPGLRSSG